MKSVDFIFCIHNHQPVGNFEHVLENAYRDAYLPFLEVLSGYPRVKVVLHNSGCLLEWMEKAHPEYFELVRTLVSRGQLELLTGGFYEPVLSSLPCEDKIGQIRKLTEYVKDNMGFEPGGLWLAERVWEPSLPSALTAAGVQYSVVDDSHFKSAGLTEGQLLGYYLTEDEGAVLRIFSGSKRLRYLIPFAEPEETLQYLRERASEERGRLLVFADDGEKFGVWPGTHALCYGKKWLERFLKALDQSREWVNVRTFSEYMAQHKPLGWVFLPTASYAEMMEWCLPAEAQLTYQALLGKLKDRGELAEYESFVKGGFWRNFLSRYPESNWMHKRMLFARRTVLEACGSIDEERRKAALNEIWRAQCNCAYWHGVFGGLYLPHLREAVYRHIIRAENVVREAREEGGRSGSLLVEGACVQYADVNGDGDQEVLLSNRQAVFYVSPALGGTLLEADHRRSEVNVLNNLARRKEAYHSRFKSHNPGAGSEKATSIHDAVVAKEANLDELLCYDRLPRLCLLDHLLPPDTSLSRMADCSYSEVGTFVTGSYQEVACTTEENECRLVLRSSGHVFLGADTVAVTIEKSLAIPRSGAELGVEYRISFERDLPSALLFAPEFNLHFSSPDGVTARAACGASRQATVSLSSPTILESFRRLSVRDEHFGFTTVISADGAQVLWQFPVETVSLSESGLERVYQCSCILPVWSLKPGVKDATMAIRLAFEE